MVSGGASAGGGWVPTAPSNIASSIWVRVGPYRTYGTGLWCKEVGRRRAVRRGGGLRHKRSFVVPAEDH